MFEQLRLISVALPWTIPAALGGALVGLATMLVGAGRRSRSDRVGFALLAWCLIVAGTVTLSPVKNSYFGVPSVGCNLNVWRPLAHEYWFSSGSRPPNVWLLAPAGVGAMLLDRFWRRFTALGFVAALPPAIEYVQDKYPALKRSCSSQDIVDNWTGLVMGVLIGLVLLVLIGIARLVGRRTVRRPVILAEETRMDGGGRGAGALPRHGGHTGDTGEFTEFDDLPGATRRGERAEPERSSDATRVLPVKTAGRDVGDDRS